VTSSCHRVKIYNVNKSKADTRARLEEFEMRGIPFVPITRPTPFKIQPDEEYEKYWSEHDPRDVDDLELSREKRSIENQCVMST
jgi:sulfite oxidase